MQEKRLFVQFAVVKQNSKKQCSIHEFGHWKPKVFDEASLESRSVVVAAKKGKSESRHYGDDADGHNDVAEDGMAIISNRHSRPSHHHHDHATLLANTNGCVTVFRYFFKLKRSLLLQHFTDSFTNIIAAYRCKFFLLMLFVR